MLLTSLGSGCDKPESTRLDEQPLPHVRVDVVAKVTPRPVTRHLVLLQPDRRARLSPRMGGQIIELLVDEQQVVEEGTGLVKLAARDSQGGLITAKGSITRIKEMLRDNKRELSTARKLARQGAESGRTVERLETEAATLKAQLREAQGTLVRAKDAVGAMTIEAPFAGTITSVDTEVGEYIGPGSVAMVLAQLDPLAVEVPLTEAEVALQDQGGLGFTVVVRGQRLEPTIEWIAQEADPGTSTFTARLQLPNGEGTLRAGESAEVEVYGPKRDPVLAVPMTAIRWSAGMPYVLRVQEGKDENGKQVEQIERVDVTVLDDEGDLVTIEGPVKVGERVVAAGPIALMPGDTVVVAESPSLKTPG